MAKIEKTMTFQELLSQYPQAAQIVASKGLHCLGCHGALFESIEQGSKMHGLSDKEIDEMLAEINNNITEKASKAKTPGKKQKAKK